MGVRDENQIPEQVFLRDEHENWVEINVCTFQYETGESPTLFLKRGQEEVFQKLVATLRGKGISVNAEKVGNYDRQ